MPTEREAMDITARARPGLKAQANVVATETRLVAGGEYETFVSVLQKMPKSALAIEDIVPRELYGQRVHVEESDMAVPRGARDNVRPARPGDSIGHRDITAGTLGCLVLDGGSPTPHILTNWHIGRGKTGKVGDAILKPGKADLGTSADRIGELLRFVPMQFIRAAVADVDALAAASVDVVGPIRGRYRVEITLANGTSEWAVTKKYRAFAAATIVADAIRLGLGDDVPPPTPPPPSGANDVDGALVAIDSLGDVSSNISGFTHSGLISAAAFEMDVLKQGRTTGRTTGKVISLDWSGSVNYGGGDIAEFENQIRSDIGSAGGDSGSAIWSVDSGDLVGLLFAGTSTSTIANHATVVASRLGFDSVWTG